MKLQNKNIIMPINKITMLKKLVFSLIVLVVIAGHVSAQETVVWAGKIREVSSETSPLQYSAMQVLHRPNVFPKGGDNPNAWKPRRDNAEEFIIVGFDTPIKVQQVAIAETENPGAVKAVYAYDKNDREYLLFELTPRSLPIQQRLLNLFFDMTPYEVAYMKVVLDGATVPGFNSIDAIGVSASNIPITVLIQVANNVSETAVSERLSTNVNSIYRENSPILSPDGKTMYFSRMYHPSNMGGVEDTEDIWYSKLDEKTGEWQPAVNMGPPLNNSGPNFISSISTDASGNLVFLLGNRYEKKDRMSVGVSLATMTLDGVVSKPENQEIANFYNYNTRVDQYLTKDNRVMFLSLERDETYGDRDLYVSFRQPNGTWSEPLNIGGNINTAAEEAAPFIADDNKTLYFSSGGYPGQGGLDIYVSKRLDETYTKWSPPENLGKAMNTPYDDVYFNIPSSGKHIYFTRGDKGEDLDIFRFKTDEFFVDPTAGGVIAANDTKTNVKPVEEEIIYVTIKGKVLNAKTNSPVSTIVRIERLPDGVEIGTTSSDANTGEYILKVRVGARYGFMAEQDGFISLNENIDLNNTKKEGVIERNLMLTPIVVGEKIVINNIFFDFDKADLQTSSFPELERIVKLLKGDKIKKIEVSGHTDSKGEDNYNLLLSKKRAASVYKFFIDNGVAANRVVSVGMGESEPVATNDTEEGRAKNRRVEFKIIE
jgi:OOP family OmpA-OmpF porin